MSEILTVTKPELLLMIGKRNPVVLDIGAFDGADSYEFAQLGCEVIAFEPLEYNRGMMRTHKNITLIPYAVSDVEGESQFYASDNNCSGSLLPPKTHLQIWPKVSFEKSKVKCITLDSWYKGFGKPIDLIWADVNGAEEQLIKGAAETLKNTKYLMIESSDKELYAGQVNIKTLVSMLPDFELVGIYNDYERFCDLLLCRK